MSLPATLVMTSPGSSRTSTGPPTETSPVYGDPCPVFPAIQASRGEVSPAVATVLGMDASALLVGLPATEIAARVRAGEVPAVEVVRAHLAHIAAVDARVGAFRVVRHEAALAEAAAVDAAADRGSLPLA